MPRNECRRPLYENLISCVSEKCSSEVTDGWYKSRRPGRPPSFYRICDEFPRLMESNGRWARPAARTVRKLTLSQLEKGSTAIFKSGSAHIVNIGAIYFKCRD